MPRDSGRRHLLRMSSLLLALVACTAPAAAQEVTVGSLPSVGQAVISFGTAFAVCLVLVLAMSGYTDRTTEMIIDEFGSTMLIGLLVSAITAIPFVVVGWFAMQADELGIEFLIGWGILVPFLAIFLLGGGIGFISVGRLASPNMGVAVAVATVLMGLVGTFPTLVVIAVPPAVMGVGAIIREVGKGDEAAKQKDRKPHPWEHRRR